MSRPIVARQRRASPVLVCKKCLKRSVDGSEVRRALKRELKQRFREDQKPPRLITTSCFGLCPKRAIVLASARSLSSGEYVLVSHRTDVEEAIDMLQPGKQAAV